MNIQQTLETLCCGRHLDEAAMQELMLAIMQGQATPAQIAGLLVALRMKGENVAEITAAARVMRKLAERVEIDDPLLIDTCGTGGDGAGTFNISTTAALVAAAAGARVAKHGNRSVSSASGSADVLQAAGVNLQLNAKQAADCIRETGFGFLFAPNHHRAMKYAIAPRRELGIRTLFNLLGPLTNPAGTRRQIIGVFSARYLQPVAETLHHLGSMHVLVLHSEDGLDEISLCKPTRVAELRDGRIRCHTITPEALGVSSREDMSGLLAGDREESLARMQAVLDNKPGPARDIVLLNAGAALYVGAQADSMREGVQKAESALQSGAARRTLQALIAFSNRYPATD